MISEALSNYYAHNLSKGLYFEIEKQKRITKDAT